MIESATLTYEGVSLQLGEGTPYRLTGFKRGIAALRNNDAVHPRGDGVRFGRDSKGAVIHELGIAIVDGTDAQEASDLADQFAAVWDAERVRSTPGSTAELRVSGNRFCVGRPRDLDPDDSGLWNGVWQTRVKFAAVNDLWYGTSSILEFGFTPEFTGGLPIPAEVPFVLGGGSGNKSRLLTVGGVTATWPVFEIHGPIVDPFIEVVGVGRLDFGCTLAYDQTLRVDTRPPRGIWRNGAPLPGALKATRSRLSDMALNPGTYSVIFGGYDPSGNSSIRVEAAPAFPSF